MNRSTTKVALLSATLLLSASLSSPVLAAGPAGMPVAPGQAANGPDAKAVMMYNLGITAYRQGSTDAAVIFFKRACDIDPNLADAQYNLAVIYQAQHRYKEAIPRFEEVLRLKPNDPDAHFQLGVVLQESGRPQDAHLHFASIAPNNPHFPEAQRRDASLGQPQSIGQMPVQQPVYQPPQTPNAMQPPINDGTNIGTAINPVQPDNTHNLSTQLQVDPNTAPQANPPAADGSLTSPVPPVSESPVPVQANTSLRIIATGFNAPSGITVDRNGNLYVANYRSNTIERIAPDGTRAQFTSGNNLRGPIGLAVDEAGNLYVANYDGGTVIRVNPAGVSSIIASGFKKPYYLTLDRDGNLYVSQQEDNSVVRITLKTTTAAKSP